MDSILITQDNHKFYGIGDIVYNYDKSNRHLKVIVNNRTMSEYRDSLAEYIWHKMLLDNKPIKNLVRAKDIIAVACNVCNTSEIEIKSKKRTENIVFARQLISWALRDRLKLTLQSVGKMVNRDHSTVIWSVDIINRPAKYLKPIQQHWKNEFINLTFGE